MNNVNGVHPSGFFVFRTPLLPLQMLNGLSEGLTAPSELGSGRGLGAAIEQDFEIVAQRLREYCADPAICEALFVASPSLETAVRTRLHDIKDARERGVFNALIRYVARMAARPTPFGLFSGCSVGTIGSDTQLVLDSRQKYRRHTRLDMHYLSALCDSLNETPGIRRLLPVRPSNGLYVAAGQLRYAEYRTDPVTRARNYSLVNVARTDYLDSTIERAAHGAYPADLAKSLVDDNPNVTQEAAAAYIDSLIDSQILVPDLGPGITGGDPLEGIIETLRDSKIGAVPEILNGVRNRIHRLDAGGLGHEPDEYLSIANELSKLPAPAEPSRLFQVDLYKPVEKAILGGEPLVEMERAIGLLSRIAAPAENAPMRRFREAFIERYGHRVEGPIGSRGWVPLVEALDEEIGIGFVSSFGRNAEPSPLLDGLVFPNAPRSNSVAYGERDLCLLNGITNALSVAADEWSLNDSDIAALASPQTPELPDAFVLIGALALNSAAADAGTNFRVFVKGLAGPSGVELLGRFCSGDTEIHRGVTAHLRAEEAARPDAVFAEVVHVPEGRMGNIICRPVLRRYEIPYLARSGSPDECQIPISDLYLTLVDGRLALFSSRMGREVIPRLTSAHNHAMSALGIYRFLCALQQEGDSRSFGWSWGPFHTAPFLPRVTSGRLVLSLARWNLTKSQIASLMAPTLAEGYKALQSLRESIRLPRWIGLADGDNVLPVDTENALHIESFLQLLKNRDTATLVEIFSRPEEALATGPEGRFVHELIVPFLNKKTSPPTQFRTPASSVRTAQRTFPPGSEWLYAKLYTGTATADEVLKEVVAPVVRIASQLTGSNGWFFIRYGDPHWHLRLRIRGERRLLSAEVLPALHENARNLLDDGRIWKLQLDTYEREVERYGGIEGIELAERVFEADSDAVLGIIELLDPEEGADARWLLALRGMHQLMVDLGFDLNQRSRLMEQCRSRFAVEHHVNLEFEKQLGARFRAVRTSLQELLATRAGAGHPLDPGLALLEARSESIAPIARALSVSEKEGRLAISMAELAASFLHMHANRLLRSEQRAQELVLYDFLLRLYESESARKRKGQ